jgi:hypothetical protein
LTPLGKAKCDLAARCNRSDCSPAAGCGKSKGIPVAAGNGTRKHSGQRKHRPASIRGWARSSGMYCVERGGATREFQEFLQTKCGFPHGMRRGVDKQAGATAIPAGLSALSPHRPVQREACFGLENGSSCKAREGGAAAVSGFSGKSVCCASMKFLTTAEPKARLVCRGDARRVAVGRWMAGWVLARRQSAGQVARRQHEGCRE